MRAALTKKFQMKSRIFISINILLSAAIIFELVAIFFQDTVKLSNVIDNILIGSLMPIVLLIVNYFFYRYIQAYQNEMNQIYSKHEKDLEQTTQEIRVTKELFLNFAEYMPAFIGIHDENNNIVYVNKIADAFLTRDFTEKISVEDALSSENTIHLNKLLKDARENNIAEMIVPAVGRDGSLHTLKSLGFSFKNIENKTYIGTIFLDISKQVEDDKNLKLLQEEKVQNYENTLLSFVEMLERRDSYSAGHSRRVATYSKMIAKEMHLTDTECDLIYRAGILHDIGKVTTPDAVLLKPSKLNDLEFKLIKNHVSTSYEILSKIPMYEDLADIVYAHHERFDGKGYPKGLKEDEISLLSHIMIVADSFDAMTTNRIYKGRKTVSMALKEIESLKFKQFHPKVVDAATIALKDLEEQDSVMQDPSSEVEHERFAYFFRDNLTGTYNTDYLDFILRDTASREKYPCLNTLNLHNFTSYNHKYGWIKGNEFLSNFAKEIRKSYPQSIIFRLHGDDFVILSAEHCTIELKYWEELPLIQENNLYVTTEHIHLDGSKLTSLEALEDSLESKK